jgi:hypothetical protein
MFLSFTDYTCLLIFNYNYFFFTPYLERTFKKKFKKNRVGDNSFSSNQSMKLLILSILKLHILKTNVNLIEQVSKLFSNLVNLEENFLSSLETYERLLCSVMRIKKNGHFQIYVIYYLLV